MNWDFPALPPRSHMLALVSAEGPLDSKSSAGLERSQGGAPVALLTWLVLILHLLSISSVLLILRRRSFVSQPESVWAGGLVSLFWALQCLDEN